jgi:hypothetical protein
MRHNTWSVARLPTVRLRLGAVGLPATAASVAPGEVHGVPLPGGELQDKMTSRRLVLFLLSVALLALTPLAYASPPDPSWIQGVYDDGDFDDVVVLLTSAVGVVDPWPLCNVGSIAPAVAPLRGTYQESAASCTLSANRSRAPPAL